MILLEVSEAAKLQDLGTPSRQNLTQNPAPGGAAHPVHARAALTLSLLHSRSHSLTLSLALSLSLSLSHTLSLSLSLSLSQPLPRNPKPETPVQIVHHIRFTSEPRDHLVLITGSQVHPYSPPTAHKPYRMALGPAQDFLGVRFDPLAT